MKRLPLAILVALGLSACTHTPIGPDYQVPAQAMVQAPAAQGAFASSHHEAYQPTALPDHWWRLFQEPQLDTLIEQALAHNTDLQQATANLERVQAIEPEVAGAGQVGVTLSGGPSYGHASGLSMLRPGYQPPNDFHYSAGAALSYQVDLFGQLHRAIEAAHANSEAAEAARDLVRVHVVAGTALAYAEACATGRRIEVAQQSVQLQQEAVTLQARLQQAGRGSVIDTARARSQLEQLHAAIPPLQAQRLNALYRLATLTGQPPSAFPTALQSCHASVRVPQPIPVGDGAALLRRRPDVRQAERELAAATAHIGVTMADRYPKVSLGLSAQSAGLTNRLGHADTLSWSLGPLISWTLPNTDVVDARIAQAQASTRMAVARFDGTVLTALRETETALNLYARELDRHAALQAARDQAAVAAEQVRRLYQNGKTGYLDTLDAERTLAADDALLAQSEAALSDEQVQLFLALGGGWEP